jgi:hypothetical protein
MFWSLLQIPWADGAQPNSVGKATIQSDLSPLINALKMFTGHFRFGVSNPTFWTFLRQCLDAGETIVLGIDANTDTRHGQFPSKLYELGLINIFLRKFGPTIPPTYARGSLPIDSIYTSASLQSC